MTAEHAGRRARALPPRPLDKSGLQDRLVEELRQLIISGELMPDVRLSEYALADSFGVSRTPVREALKQLEVEGLIEIVPRVGTFVAHPSEGDVDELFAIKAVLEGLAARLVAELRPEDALRDLRANVEATRRAVAADDLDAFVSLIDEFHELVVAGAENGKLLSHHRLLTNQLAYRRLVRDAFAGAEDLQEPVDRHEAILGLVEKGDGLGAETAMRADVAASHRTVRAALPSAEGSSLAR